MSMKSEKVLLKSGPRYLDKTEQTILEIILMVEVEFKEKIHLLSHYRKILDVELFKYLCDLAVLMQDMLPIITEPDEPAN